MPAIIHYLPVNPVWRLPGAWARSPRETSDPQSVPESVPTGRSVLKRIGLPCWPPGEAGVKRACPRVRRLPAVRPGSPSLRVLFGTPKVLPEKLIPAGAPALRQGPLQGPLPLGSVWRLPGAWARSPRETSYPPSVTESVPTRSSVLKRIGLTGGAPGEAW